MGRIWVGRERGDEWEEKDVKEKQVADVYSVIRGTWIVFIHGVQSNEIFLEYHNRPK